MNNKFMKRITAVIIALGICAPLTVYAEKDEIAVEAIEAAEKTQIEDSTDNKNLPDGIKYKSKLGWSVVYHLRDFDAYNGKNFAKFVYKNAAPDANTVEIRYIEGIAPEKALDKFTADWTDDRESIMKINGVFPGTDDKPGYRRTYQSDDIWKTAIAGEYKDGVLLILVNEEFDVGSGTAISDSLSEIVNSIKFE